MVEPEEGSEKSRKQNGPKTECNQCIILDCADELHIGGMPRLDNGKAEGRKVCGFYVPL